MYRGRDATIKVDLDTKVWQTREGEEIPVSQMTTKHILNTIRFLSRRKDDFANYPTHWYEDERERIEINWWCRYWIKIFELELKRRKAGRRRTDEDRRSLWTSI